MLGGFETLVNNLVVAIWDSWEPFWRKGKKGCYIGMIVTLEYDTYESNGPIVSSNMGYLSPWDKLKHSSVIMGIPKAQRMIRGWAYALICVGA